VHPASDNDDAVDRDAVAPDEMAHLAPSLDELVDRAAELRATAPANRRLLIGIAGAPGVGKTTLAGALVAELQALGIPTAHVPMDGFHLADIALEQLDRRERKGAPDTFDAGGYAALLMRLAAGEAVWAPAFERELEQPLAQAIHIGREAEVIISEGNYLLLHAPEWRSVRRWFDEIWFCALDDDLRRERLIARHIEFGKDPEQARAWVMRVDEANARAVAGGAADADLLIDLSC
jgi:pantothenate kinase